MVDTVLCDEIVYRDVCRALKFTSLVSSISIVKVNLMVIGRYQSWIINTATTSRVHFVGTRKLVGLTAEGTRA